MANKILGVYPVNPDLISERSKSSFNGKDLTYFLEGDQEKTERRKELEKMFYEDDSVNDLLSNQPVDYMTYDEIYEEALIKASKMYFKALNMDDPREMLAVAEAFHLEASPLLLHFIMFLPALMGHATEDQLEKWLPLAIELKIIGTYAQTELGHGTFIRGLETRATYDVSSQEFVLETPSLTSIKWWPGGLGKTANYAIVLAQLYTQGICRGVHPFMVQLRDEDTHLPLKGIVVGEIGPKMGLKAADNGFLQLNKVRIPRDHMLMKNSQVEVDGSYHSPKSDKLTYGTMVLVRVLVIDMCAFNVARAATIAVRYSAVRRQAKVDKIQENGEEGKEVQIIDYQAQQYKLFPVLSLAHAFKATFVALMGAYKDVADDIELRGDLEKLGELHAMSSGLKALSSELGSSAIETCRKATGGHGYLLMSGLPRLYATTVAACTYEGENTVLYLQTARYLLKCLDRVNTGELDTQHVTSYLRLNLDPNDKLSSLVNHAVDTSNLESLLIASDQNYDQVRNNEIFTILLQVFQASARRLVNKSRERLNSLINSPLNPLTPERAWIECQIDLIRGAKAHLMQFLLSKYVVWLSSAPETISVVLTRLALLLFYTKIVENPGDYLLVGLKESHLSLIEAEIRLLLKQLRPDAVTLVDAFDFHDIVLMSSLGCYDGAVYERMFDLAKRSPLNKVDPHPAFIKNIHSLTKSKL